MCGMVLNAESEICHALGSMYGVFSTKGPRVQVNSQKAPSPCWRVYHEGLVFFFVDQSSRAGLAGFRDMSLGPGSKKKFSAAKPPCIPISVFVVDYLQRV